MRGQSHEVLNDNRERGTDPAGHTRRGQCSAKRRGARVYCNRRLAAGPTLFDLQTGMHNFHSQNYMECVVEADALDKYNVDLINTNRSDFRRDNDVIDKFVENVTELMRKTYTYEFQSGSSSGTLTGTSQSGGHSVATFTRSSSGPVVIALHEIYEDAATCEIMQLTYGTVTFTT